MGPIWPDFNSFGLNTWLIFRIEYYMLGLTNDMLCLEKPLFDQS